jgi:hypothetical protein
MIKKAGGVKNPNWTGYRKSKKTLEETQRLLYEKKAQREEVRRKIDLITLSEKQGKILRIEDVGMEWSRLFSFLANQFKILDYEIANEFGLSDELRERLRILIMGKLESLSKNFEEIRCKNPRKKP